MTHRRLCSEHGGSRATTSRDIAWRGALVLAVCLSAGGCSLLARSSLPLVYNVYFDNLVEERLTGFMDLADRQEEFVESRVDEYVAWHRREMLPRYASYLEGQAAVIRRGSVSPEQVRQGEDGVRALWIRSVQPLSVWTSALMVDLSAAQLDYMEREWRAKHEEDTEFTNKPRAERIDDATERVSDAFDDFLVEVEDRQEREIRRWMTQLADRPRSWVNERVRRWDVLLEKLRSGAGQREIQAYLALLYADPARLSPPDYQRGLEKSREIFRDFLYRFFASLSDEQREEFASNLEDLAEDFRDLAN